jgi:hypothetical protein
MNSDPNLIDVRNPHAPAGKIVPEIPCRIAWKDSQLFIVCNFCGEKCNLQVRQQKRSTSGAAQDTYSVLCPHCGEVASLLA